MNNAPIILIHGWGMNKQVWNGVIAASDSSLARRIVAVDMPGYGDNDECPSRYDMEALVLWLRSIVNEPSHIIGWSLGGLLAQKFSALHPDLTLSLGLVASTPKFVSVDGWPGIRRDVLNAFSSQLAVSHEDTVKRFLKIQALGSESIRKDLQQIQEWLFSVKSPSSHALKAGLTMLNEEDLRDIFSSIRVPVYALFGRQDSLVPSATADMLKNILPSATIAIQDKASHAPFISNKNQFVTWLRTNFA